MLPLGLTLRRRCIQADGKIVAAGYAESGRVRFAVVRPNANGSLDTTFGGTGESHLLLLTYRTITTVSPTR